MNAAATDDSASAATLQLDDGPGGVEPRAFLADGDSVIFKGF